VRDHELLVLLVAVGKRERNALDPAHHAVHDRMDDRPSIHVACRPSVFGSPTTWSAD
jgi:hypothetical protein